MKEVRLIDANALKEKGIKWFIDERYYHPLSKPENMSESRFTSLVDNTPTLTPSEIQAIMSDYLVYRKEERPQGEWKLIRVADHCGIHDSFVCPFCNYEREYRKKNFCEECGADLRGEQK
jgi:hypothetical protein